MRQKPRDKTSSWPFTDHVFHVSELPETGQQAPIPFVNMQCFNGIGNHDSRGGELKDKAEAFLNHILNLSENTLLPSYFLVRMEQDLEPKSALLPLYYFGPYLSNECLRA